MAVFFQVCNAIIIENRIALEYLSFIRVDRSVKKGVGTKKKRIINKNFYYGHSALYAIGGKKKKR